MIVNVADSTHLAPALELILELLPLNKPMTLALNMMDEASRPGLRGETGVPLIFGIFCRELSLVMPYLPCLATQSTLKCEPGTRAMLTIGALTVAIALISALLPRPRIDHVEFNTSMAAAAIRAEPRIKASSLKSNFGW